jgi:hypothetical protein
LLVLVLDRDHHHRISPEELHRVVSMAIPDPICARHRLHIGARIFPVIGIELVAFNRDASPANYLDYVRP